MAKPKWIPTQEEAVEQLHQAAEAADQGDLDKAIKLAGMGFTTLVGIRSGATTTQVRAELIAKAEMRRARQHEKQQD